MKTMAEYAAAIAGEYDRIYKLAESLGIANLGKPDDEPNLELIKYLETIESRLSYLESKMEV
jgi:hypothetical protein